MTKVDSVENKKVNDETYDQFKYMSVTRYEYGKDPITITDLKDRDVPTIPQSKNKGKIFVTLQEGRHVDAEEEDLLQLIFSKKKMQLAPSWGEDIYSWKDNMELGIFEKEFNILDGNECIFELKDPRSVYQKGDCWTNVYTSCNNKDHDKDCNNCDDLIVINYGDVSSVMIFSTLES